MTRLSKDFTPASTISTQLLLTNLLLAIADLPGPAGGIALGLTLGLFPWMVGLLRISSLPRLLAKAGHTANDLQVLNKIPESCLLGCIQRVLPLFFSFYCSFIQSFQLQSSKVSDDSPTLQFNRLHKKFVKYEEIDFVVSWQFNTYIIETIVRIFSWNTTE